MSFVDNANIIHACLSSAAYNSDINHRHGIIIAAAAAVQRKEKSKETERKVKRKTKLQLARRINDEIYEQKAVN